MGANDFVYDGISLSSLGYIIVEFDSSSGFDDIKSDSQRDFDSFSLMGGKWMPLSVSTYKDSLKLSFSIMKNPVNADSQEDLYISVSDIRAIKRWLNRPTFHTLRAIYDNDEYAGIFFNASANVEEVHFLDKCVGFNIDFTTDRPFALGDEITISGSVAANGTITITDASDEIGYIYPDVQITCGSSGTLNILNDFDNSATIIQGCSADEVITISNVFTDDNKKPQRQIDNLLKQI